MSFGGLRALEAGDLDIRRGEIVALIGPNGARQRLNGLKPNQVTERGLARTFQNIRLFPNMTALENVMVGRHCRTRAGVLGAVLRGVGTRAEERETAARSYDLLRRVGLHPQANELAKNLPY